jgi:hypothetical protein
MRLGGAPAASTRVGLSISFGMDFLLLRDPPAGTAVPAAEDRIPGLHGDRDGSIR